MPEETVVKDSTSYDNRLLLIDLWKYPIKAIGGKALMSGFLVAPQSLNNVDRQFLRFQRFFILSQEDVEMPSTGEGSDNTN